MSTVEILPKTFFSMRTAIKQNAHYITDFHILYPAGSVLIMQNYYEKRQKYINLYEKSAYLEMIAISYSRKLAAIIENGERGQILVIDMKTLKKRRTLNLPPDSKTNRFETIAFTHDDIYLIAITGEPDWNLVTYKWGKGKVTSISKAIINNTTSTVTQRHREVKLQICCSPTDASEICLIGHGLFRLLSLSETVWRQYGFQKADQINITTAAYLTGSRIICGTGDGRLFLIENGDLRGIYNALMAMQISLKEKDDSPLIGSSSLLMIRTMSREKENNEDIVVRTLIAFPKGFAYSCKSGYVHLFEKIEANKYKKRNVFRIIDTILSTVSEVELNIIHHLSINVSQDQLLATTNRAQLYTVQLWGPDINVAPEIQFKHLGESLHHGPINGLSVSLWKPLFVTSGKLDQSIRLWNYETETIQLMKQFPAEIYSIHLHPTGSFIAIGFQNELHISVILINDINTYRVLPVKECEFSRFSFYGHNFAAVNGKVIDAWQITLMNKLFSLKGHIGKIIAFQWTMEDKKIVSCSSAGEIFTWDALEGTLLNEIQTPELSYSDVAVSQDGKFIYAIASDGCLKEFCNSILVKSVSFGQINLHNVRLSRSNQFMFVTGDTVLSVKMNLSDPPEYTSYHYHASKITRVQLAWDEQTLITISGLGTVILWKIIHVDKAMAADKTVIYSKEVLISKTALQEHISKIKESSQKLYELELAHAKEIRDTESSYCDKMKEIHEHYTVAIEELKEKIAQTEADQEKQLTGIRKEIDMLKEKQEKEKADLVENYRKKLLVEHEKVKALEALKVETIQNFENQVSELEKSKEEETNELIRTHEQKLVDVNNLLQQAYEKNIKNISEHEKIKQLLEEDTDREIVELKAKYEGILKEEKERHVFLKDETALMRRKNGEVQKEKDGVREKLVKLQSEMNKYQANISALEKDVSDLKAEIVERDTTVAEKDETIFSLKKRIQELDKVKFILDFKVKELRKEIDPKDREIWEKKEQIADMEVELYNLKKINASLELQVSELKEKIKGTEKEVKAFERKSNSVKNTMRQIRVDIYTLQQEANDLHNLKDGIKALYHKYHSCDIESVDQFGESDLQRELLRERDFLEKTIMALKSTLQKSQLKKLDNTKILRDNVVLLEELNLVRKDLKEAREEVQKLETLTGVKGKRVLVPSAAFHKLQQTLKERNDIKEMYQTMINEADEEAKELNVTVKKMQDKLRQLLVTKKL